MARVIVVGGGAAGLVAAWRAALRGHAVTLLEANPRVGVKLRISGGGRCNVTHEGTVQELLGAFPARQARFLRHAFHAFDGRAVVALLASQGIQTQARENGRVFPVEGPGAAVGVVAAFRALAEGAGTTVRLGARVTGLAGLPPKIAGVWVGGQELRGDAVILAPGGASYPGTGSRGEVAGWLEALGVPVAPWFPALAPIPLAEPLPAFEGTAFRGGILRLTAGPGGRRLASCEGDLVFTREGISGPAALELSQRVEAARREGAAWLAYDFRRLDPGVLDREILSAQKTSPRRFVRGWLQQWIPERVAQDLGQREGIEDLRLKDLGREARRRVLGWLTAFPLGAPRALSLERGEVCAGGVRLEAVDPRTMRLRGWDNLFVCGELLDVDGPIGGFNLQAAFSTGFVAGEAAGDGPIGGGTPISAEEPEGASPRASRRVAGASQPPGIRG
ncbi:MAG: aminoacetone oxidase family FAD-binding enzyme [Acidobacteria bacterium]|nr:aminoacetone oxidase family FAD-binding enzyme [Acidobacteriota bacterium]